MSLLSTDVLIAQWEEDSKPNKIDPEVDLLRIPNLHSKYSSQIVLRRKAQRKSKNKYLEVLRLKTDYYSGNLNNKKDLDTTGWDAFPYKVKGKSDLDSYLNADKDLNVLRDELGEHEDAIEFCQSICGQIHDRTWSIKAYLDFAKYKLGS